MRRTAQISLRPGWAALIAVAALPWLGVPARAVMDVAPGEWFYGMYLMEHKIGYLRELTELIEFEGRDAVRTRHEGVMSLSPAVEPMSVSQERVYSLDRGELLYLESVVDSPMGRNVMRARREPGGFAVVSEIGGRDREEFVAAEAETLDQMAAVKQLLADDAELGDTVTVETFLIERMDVSTITFTLVERRTAVIHGLPIELFSLEAQYEDLGLTAVSVLDRAGIMIEGRFAGQFRLKLEDESVARNLDQDQDLILELALFPSEPIGSIRQQSRLVLAVTGVDDPALRLDTGLQRWAPADPGWTLTVDRPPVPDEPPLLPVTGEGLEPYLEPTHHIQSDAPELIEKAAEIIGAERDSARAARLIADWVYRSVDKVLISADSNALDTLRELRGDCTEHAALFAGLARAAGLPARIVSGLAYSDSLQGFFYHQWNEVWLGGWVPVDPTWGWFPAGAGHLAFIAGHKPESARMLSLIGSIDIQVLKTYIDAE